MDGWIDGMDGWMDGWIDKQIDIDIDIYIDHFLDNLALKDEQGNINTDVYHKSTDTRPYLHWTSAYPPHLKHAHQQIH